MNYNWKQCSRATSGHGTEETGNTTGSEDIHKVTTPNLWMHTHLCQLYCCGRTLPQNEAAAAETTMPLLLAAWLQLCDDGCLLPPYSSSFLLTLTHFITPLST
eukprot:GHUV01025441.1.p2 GENE.GHUV01025441.1~~GHUV01025441.1.p2  ORF type:complete len:103 (-),score=9.94 GHUV01025441.1:895-1203(-)